MSRYAGIAENDFAAAPGVSVTVFTQGCPHRCLECYNMETWEYEGGNEFTNDLYEKIYSAIKKNGIERNLVIQGGEPLCPENMELTWSIIKYIKEKSPETKCYVYTGYYLCDLMKMYCESKEQGEILQNILNSLEWLKVGPYDLYKRDITLQYMGSSNQEIVKCPLTFGGKIDKINIDKNEKIDKGDCNVTTDINN